MREVIESCESGILYSRKSLKLILPPHVSSLLSPMKRREEGLTDSLSSAREALESYKLTSHDGVSERGGGGSPVRVSHLH